MNEEDTLENRNRRRVYRHICEFPGVSFPKLKDLLDMNEGTLRYHLHYLERSGMIRAGSENGLTLYFSSERIPFKDDIKGRVPSGTDLTEGQLRLLSTVKRSGGMSQKAICSQLGMNRFTLRYNMRTLMDLELVRVVKRGRNMTYHFIREGDLDRMVLKRAAYDLLHGRISEEEFLRIKRIVGPDRSAIGTE